MRILGLRLQARRPYELRHFYSDTLGLPRLGYDLQAGGTTLTFGGGHPPSPFHFAFNIPENQLDEAKAWITEHVALLERDGSDTFHFDFWNAHALYFEDPEANVVELIARHGLPNASDAPVGPDSLVEVSEVGLPTSDVGATVAFIERDLEIPFFSGDRSGFAAVGDEYGLFIVVPIGRPWFPTQVPARPSRIEITIAGARDEAFEVPGTPYRIVTRAG